MVVNNMLEHQRSILATLGIDLWIPKSDAKTYHYTTSLFRDTVESETSTSVNFEIETQSIAVISDDIHVADQSLEIAIDQGLKTRSEPEVEEVENLIPQKHKKTNLLDTNTQTESSLILEVEAFTIQAFSVDQVIILIDSTMLNKEQLQLWNNIQTAMMGILHELKWPFALAQFQDGRGITAYLQGFMDAMCQDKKIISLGALPHYQNDHVIQLVSLQEMLNQPLLKRDLWQLMKN